MEYHVNQNDAAGRRQLMGARANPYYDQNRGLGMMRNNGAAYVSELLQRQAEQRLQESLTGHITSLQVLSPAQIAEKYTVKAPPP